jgi:hypothetical protein
MRFVYFFILIFNFLKFCINYSKVKLMKTSSTITSRSQLKSLFTLTLSSSKANSNLNFLNTHEKNQDYEKINIDPKENIGSGPIYSQGWMHYFILTSKTKTDNSSKKFLINESYEKEIGMQEKKLISNYDPKMLIPNEKSFYYILTDNLLFIISSRFVINIYFIILNLASSN